MIEAAFHRSQIPWRPQLRRQPAWPACIRQAGGPWLNLRPKITLPDCLACRSFHFRRQTLAPIFLASGAAEVDLEVVQVRRVRAVRRQAQVAPAIARRKRNAVGAETAIETYLLVVAATRETHAIHSVKQMRRLRCTAVAVNRRPIPCLLPQRCLRLTTRPC